MRVVVGMVLAAGIPVQQYLHDRISRDHSRLHRGMRPLDLGKIQRTGIASDDEGAGQGHFWQ